MTDTARPTTPTRQPAQMAAFAVALSARTDGLTAHLVDDMRGKAEELLPPGDPLRSAILHFCTMHMTWHRDRDAMRRFGEELQRALDADLHPDRPARMERRDIDG